MKVNFKGNRRKWFRAMQNGDMGFGYFPGLNELDSLSVLLSHFNSGEGVQKGLYIHHKFDRKKKIAYLYCVKSEEREDEKKGMTYAKKWKEKLSEWAERVHAE